MRSLTADHCPQSAKDALDRTIVIHPGSRWLRIGLASQVAPVSVPNVIARKRLPGYKRAAAEPAAPSHDEPSSRGGKSRATSDEASTSARPDVPGPSAAPTDTEMKDEHGGWDSDDPNADPDSLTAADSDPLTAKITSLRGDLRARMRVYKLRGQGNGNSQAATYNATVKPESMGEDFEGDFEWTTGEAEVWTGLHVSTPRQTRALVPNLIGLVELRRLCAYPIPTAQITSCGGPFFEATSTRLVTSRGKNCLEMYLASLRMHCKKNSTSRRKS